MNAGEGVEKRELSYTVGGNRNWYIHYGEHYGDALKSKNRATIWSSKGFPGGSDSEESALIQETGVWSLGWEDSPEKGMATHSSILGLENSMDRGAWQTTVHGVAESQTWLSD